MQRNEHLQSSILVDAFQSPKSWKIIANVHLSADALG